MAVPADIRAVPRPKNTIVDDSGRDGPKRYAVRERASTKYVSGGNPQPRNGKVVGHIINYEYVPVDTEIKSAPAVPDMLSYGSSALVHSVTRDIEKDLLAVYDPADVFAIMSVATLRVIKPSITANRMMLSRVCLFAISMDCSLPGSSVHGISQARILQWVAISSARGSCQVKDQTCVPALAGGYFTAEPPGKPYRLHVKLLN